LEGEEKAIKNGLKGGGTPNINHTKKKKRVRTKKIKTPERAKQGGFHKRPAAKSQQDVTQRRKETVTS